MVRIAVVTVPVMLRGDGIDDLLAVFWIKEVREILELGSASPGEQVMLTLTGVGEDGIPFAASDCVVIGGKR